MADPEEDTVRAGGGGEEDTSNRDTMKPIGYGIQGLYIEPKHKCCR